MPPCQGIGGAGPAGRGPVHGGICRPDGPHDEKAGGYAETDVPGRAAQDAGMAAEFGCVNPEICPAATDGDPDGPVPPGFPQIAGVGKETVRHAMGSGAASRHRAALSAGEKDVLEYTPVARPLCPDSSTDGKACVREGLCFVHEEGLGGSIILRIREDQTTSLRIL